MNSPKHSRGIRATLADIFSAIKKPIQRRLSRRPGSSKKELKLAPSEGQRTLSPIVSESSLYKSDTDPDVELVSLRDVEKISISLHCK